MALPMTEEEKFKFDLCGFLVRPAVLTASTAAIQAFSVGECLREVDTMDVIKGDFILVRTRRQPCRGILSPGPAVTHPAHHT